MSIDAIKLDCSYVQSCMSQQLPLSELLKTQTSPVHRDIEKNPMIRSIFEPGFSVERYRHLLQALYLYYQPLEEQIDAYLKQSKDLNLAYKNKSHLLEEDIYGLTINENNVFDTSEVTQLIPKLDSKEKLIGCIYVLEGAAMGGQIMYRRIQKKLGGQVASSTAFYGYPGTDLAIHWSAIKNFIDSNKIQPKKRVHVVDGAKEVFISLDRWLKTCHLLFDQPENI